MSDDQGSFWGDGETFDFERDSARLGAQMTRVRLLMADGHWRTLRMIAHQTGDPEASVSARLRDLRKKRFGSHVVQRQYVMNGEWEYRMLPGGKK